MRTSVDVSASRPPPTARSDAIVSDPCVRVPRKRYEKTLLRGLVLRVDLFDPPEYE